MRYLKILVALVFFSKFTYADFSNLGIVQSKDGESAACTLAEEKIHTTSMYFEKAYYFGWLASCQYKTSGFLSKDLDEKIEIINVNSEKKAKYIIVALDSNEALSNPLLTLLGVESSRYPKIFERLSKKELEVAINTPQEVIDENEGDVHEMGPAVFNSYYEMAMAYIVNDRDEDAERIIQEYGVHLMGGASGTKRLERKLLAFRDRLEQKRARKKVEKAKKTDVQNKTKNSVAPDIIKIRQ